MSAPRTIPETFFLRGEAVTIDGAAAEGSEKRRFAMTLYSGRPFNGWGFNAILDLDGLEIAADQVMPILRQHSGTLVVGQSDKIAKSAAKGIQVEGEIYPDTGAGREVLALSARGFRWQASFGAQPKFGEGGAFEWVDRDEQKTVNGHVFSDGLIIRKARLKEGSFVPLGADPNTSAIAASADGAPQITLPERRTKIMSEPIKATIPELKAAFPKNLDFVLEQAEKGATLDQAKAAYADVLQAELKAKDEQLAETKKTLEAAQRASSSPRRPIAVGGGAASGGEGGTFVELVRAGTTRGLTKAQAIREAAIQNPGAHAAYVAQANGGKLPEGRFETR